ncbi:phage tail assembly chaperone [Listeria monocytogenes]|nr:phage tail assembly chaperone [Listeria monocytogenes]EAC7891599.1 phage tail assembly chaperone [Listeria monocytogenes]EAC8616901.1 phage tail assembly chaperone [Listeria monocytogenes]EAC9739386.1 phage tail assembly chaperone [Listeria monocytogenes]EAC9744262.1 phage tail assembly chaperone [Listeria monocytogenes]
MDVNERYKAGWRFFKLRPEAVRQLTPLEFSLMIEAEQDAALDRTEQLAIQAYFNAVANTKKIKSPEDIYKRPSKAELAGKTENPLDAKLEQQKALEEFTKKLDLSQII